MKNTLFLVRHTRVAVAEGLCYGQTDVELASTFPAEWPLVQKRLAGVIFSHAYCSPLTRCKRLAAKLHKSVFTDNRLLEMHFGNWEGIPWDTIFASQEGKAWFANYMETPCPNGEAYYDLHNRVTLFTETIAGMNGNILVVTHAGVIRAMLEILCRVERNQVFDKPVPYGQIITITNNEYTYL